MSINELLFLVIVYFAAVVSTVIGFGSAQIALPFASLVVDIKKAVVIITIFYLSLNISKTLMFRKHIDWQVSKLLIIGQIPGGIIGATAFLFLPADILRKILGLMILGYVVNSLLKVLPKIKIGTREIIGTGFLYAIFAGLVGTGSAIKAPVLLSLGLYKGRFTGTHSFTALINNILKLFIYVLGGMLSLNDFYFGMVLSAIGVLGVLTGSRLLHLVTPDLFKKMVLIMLAFASVKLLI